MTRIIGIDPGLHVTGWGVIDYDGLRLSHVAHGSIVSDSSTELSARLGGIYRKLHDVLEKTSPDEASIENIFVNGNPFSSLKLGMARGVAICVTNMMGVKLFEYAPNAIKKTVVGVGHAFKDQVTTMVQTLLNCNVVKQDAADALAVAICHAHHSNPYGT
ncbi:MAG: crossover junction endodeoxyribonuclease RuvC [Holosporaceae bacterium]|nr:crossover junction endodeoxyribonuclease RuvC [Holosporaceae bacterium]